MLHEVMSSRTSYNTAWDGVFIDLAISLSFFTPFSRINFLGYPPLVLLSCCFSERVLDFLWVLLHTPAGPGISFRFCISGRLACRAF